MTVNILLFPGRRRGIGVVGPLDFQIVRVMDVWGGDISKMDWEDKPSQSNILDNSS